ncbi:MAG: hypothetical protein ACK5UT_17600 [Acidobacteriota bacterium]|jgi:hypothetical protein
MPSLRCLAVNFAAVVFITASSLAQTSGPGEQRAKREADRSEREANRAKSEADRSEKEANRAKQEADRSQKEANPAKQEADRSKKEADGAAGQAASASDERKAAETASQNAEKARDEARKYKDDISKIKGENGISIGRTKVFDNRTLTLMLESLNETLRAQQLIDADPIKKVLGLVQGSRVTDVARALTVLAGGTPKVENTIDNTSETTTPFGSEVMKGLKEGKENDYTLTNGTGKTVETEKGKTVTTNDARNPSIPQLPDLIAGPSGLPSYGQSGADLLTDQVNLTYQIFNLRMIIDRALTDRLDSSTQKPRLQAVLGFNVSIDPPRDAVDSAAIVELTLEPVNGAPVSLVAMMPQEKTYNSMALNSKSNAFGASAVAKMVTVGYTERRRGQIFYLYRDNDTLSFERMNSNENKLTFGWQFRPVLGRRSVAPGMRQMFAVVSLPVPDALTESGPNPFQELKVSMRTYWRKYYPDTLTTSDRDKIGPWPYLKEVASLGLARAVPNGKIAERFETSVPVKIPLTKTFQEDLAPKIKTVSWTQLDAKTGLVSVTGDNFFSGTTVALGGPSAVNNVIIKSNQAMDVITPIENIGAGEPMVLGRYGSAQPLRQELNCSGSILPQESSLSAAYASQRSLRFTIQSDCTKAELESQSFVILANGKPINARPLVRVEEKKLHRLVQIDASLPAASFPKSEGLVTVSYPFRGSDWSIDFPLVDPVSVYEVQRVSETSSNATVARIYVRKKDGDFTDKRYYGDKPEQAWKLKYKGAEMPLSFPSPNLLEAVLTDSPDDGQVVLFEPKPLSASVQQPRVLDLPSAQPKPKPAIEAAKGTSLSVQQYSTPKLEFTGEKIADVARVVIQGLKDLAIENDLEKKMLTVYLEETATERPADKRAIQFRDSASRIISTLNLEIKPNPAAKPTQPTQKQ